MEDLVAKLTPPRAVWLMVPAGVTTAVLSDVTAHLAAGDTVIDGGNTHYADDIARSEQLLGQRHRLRGLRDERRDIRVSIVDSA